MKDLSFDNKKDTIIDDNKFQLISYKFNKERCHAKFLEGHNLLTSPLIGPRSQTKFQPHICLTA